MKRSILIMLLLLFTGFMLSGDDTAVSENPVSGNLFLIDENDLQMVEEYVEYKEGKITALFLFENTSDKAKSVKIGFPVIGDITGAGQPMLAGMESPYLSEEEKREEIEKYYKFQCFVNGKKVDRILEKADAGLPYTYFFTTTVKFDPKERIEIKDQFNLRPSGWTDSLMNREGELKYILKTGAGWKGVIKKAVIKFYVAGFPESEYEYDSLGRPWIHGLSASPEGFKVMTDDDGTYFLWEFENLEPDFDIVLSWFSWTTGSGKLDLPLLQDVIAYVAYYLTDIDLDKPANEEYFFNSGDYDVLFQGLYSFIKSYHSRVLTGAGSYVKVRNRLADGTYYSISEVDYEAVIKTLRKNDINEFLLLTRFYINGEFAKRGYAFSKEKWRKLFSKFSWYSGRTKSVTFEEPVQKQINEVLEIEKEIKELIKKQSE